MRTIKLTDIEVLTLQRLVNTEISHMEELFGGDMHNYEGIERCYNTLLRMRRIL